MKGKNKKTKVKKVKKTASKSVAKKPKNIKKAVKVKKISASILGAKIEVAQSLGKKINVVEVREETPEILRADLSPQDDNQPATPEENDFENDNQPAEPEDENENKKTEAEQEDVLESEVSAADSDIKENEYMPKKDLTPLQKNIIMYTGIACVMAALVVFWGLSIKASLSQNLPAENYLEEIKSEDLIDQMKDTIDGVKDGLSQAQNLNQNTNDLQAVKEKIIETQLKNEIADQLKDKLENLNTNNININK
ncbi:MAG: hypothetical protein NTZ49_01530 [Candidatus Parcubacteria bacterium]|nr:hypothetical protein [Candidatus Parcubacteria bacterium]